MCAYFSLSLFFSRPRWVCFFFIWDKFSLHSNSSSSQFSRSIRRWAVLFWVVSKSSYMSFNCWASSYRFALKFLVSSSSRIFSVPILSAFSFIARICSCMFSISWVAAWTFFSPAIFSSSKVRSLARYSSYRCYWSSFIFISSAYSFYNCFSFTYSSSSWCSVAFLSKADISA